MTKQEIGKMIANARFQKYGLRKNFAATLPGNFEHNYYKLGRLERGMAKYIDVFYLADICRRLDIDVFRALSEDIKRK
jgi:hypothetical protein